MYEQEDEFLRESFSVILQLLMWLMWLIWLISYQLHAVSCSLKPIFLNSNEPWISSPFNTEFRIDEIYEHVVSKD